LLIGILKETAPGETRVALLPESLKSLLAQGVEVRVEAGAGWATGASDEAYGAGGRHGDGGSRGDCGQRGFAAVVNAPSAAIKHNSRRAVVIGFLKPP